MKGWVYICSYNKFRRCNTGIAEESSTYGVVKDGALMGDNSYANAVNEADSLLAASIRNGTYLSTMIPEEFSVIQAHGLDVVEFEQEAVSLIESGPGIITRNRSWMLALQVGPRTTRSPRQLLSGVGTWMVGVDYTTREMGAHLYITRVLTVMNSDVMELPIEFYAQEHLVDFLGAP